MAFTFLHGLRTQDLKYTFSGGYAKIPIEEQYKLVDELQRWLDKYLKN
jgi:hypothetical protein